MPTAVRAHGLRRRIPVQHEPRHFAPGLKLDDPSFAAPIYANLFDDEDGKGASLVWSRPNTRRGD